MRPQLQTEFGEHGNCMSACVASILDLDLADVPNWIRPTPTHTHWWSAFNAWCEERGLGVFRIRYDVVLDVAERKSRTPLTLIEYVECMGLADMNVVTCGYGPRGYRHATVYRGGELVFDPHPEGGGLLNVEEIFAIAQREITEALYQAALHREI